MTDPLSPLALFGPQVPPQRPPDPPDCMTADELARFLRCDRKTVYENVHEIPHQRLGRRLLFLRAAIVAWLASEPALRVRRGTSATARPRGTAVATHGSTL